VTLRIALAVAVGAVAGALLRHALSLALPRLGGALPLGTLAVNLVGSFVLGVLAGWSGPDGRGSPELRAALGTGFCGALTTMSTFAVEAVAQPPVRAAGWIALHVGGSLASAAAGIAVGRAARGA
jgi:CrcB protein